MSAHTPGPWSAGDVRYQRDFRTFVNVESEREDFVACVSADPMHPETIAANARLIAAAPDLLDSLESCVRFLNKHCPGAEHLLPAAEAAIALATGETPR